MANQCCPINVHALMQIEFNLSTHDSTRDVSGRPPHRAPCGTYPQPLSSSAPRSSQRRLPGSRARDLVGVPPAAGRQDATSADPTQSGTRPSVGRVLPPTSSAGPPARGCQWAPHQRSILTQQFPSLRLPPSHARACSGAGSFGPPLLTPFRRRSQPPPLSLQPTTRFPPPHPHTRSHYRTCFPVYHRLSLSRLPFPPTT